MLRLAEGVITGLILLAYTSPAIIMLRAEMVSRVAKVPSARAEVMAAVASLSINRNSRLSLIGG